MTSRQRIGLWTLAIVGLLIVASCAGLRLVVKHFFEIYEYGSVSEAAGVAVGDEAKRVDVLLGDDRFIRVGEAVRKDGGLRWHHQHVQGGGTPRLVTSAEKQGNQFLDRLVYTYLTTPVSHRLIIVPDREAFGDHLYFHADAQGRITEVFMGGS
jgi:hypothetical protein